jgi:hypothetical protein
LDGPAESAEHEKEVDSVNEDDIGDNHDDIKDDRDGDNNDYHDIDLDSDEDDDKDEKSNTVRLCLLKQESLRQRRLPFLKTSCLQL